MQATVVHQHFQRGSEVDVHAAGGVGIAVGHTGFGTARNGIVQRLVDRAALDGVQGHHFLVVDELREPGAILNGQGDLIQETVGRARMDADREVGRRDGLVRQSRPFRTQQHRDAAVLQARFAQRGRVGPRRQRGNAKPVVLQQLQPARPGVQGGERDAQHMPHRDADAAPVQRVRATRAEQDTVHTERGGVAEQRAEVLVVAHAFEDGQLPGPSDEIGRVDRGRPVGHGQ